MDGFADNVDELFSMDIIVAFLIPMLCVGTHTEAVKMDAVSTGPIQTFSSYRQTWHYRGRYALPRRAWERVNSPNLAGHA